MYKNKPSTYLFGLVIKVERTEKTKNRMKN